MSMQSVRAAILVEGARCELPRLLSCGVQVCLRTREEAKPSKDSHGVITLAFQKVRVFKTHGGMLVNVIKLDTAG